MAAFVKLEENWWWRHPKMFSFFSVCIFMSRVPFTYCIHTHARKGLIILGNLYLLIGSSSSSERVDSSVAVQIKENFHSPLYFRSMNSHLRLAGFFLLSRVKTGRLL
jgi:hypothetical protein